MPDSLYSVVLMLHVISAVVLLGSGLHAPIVRGLLIDARSLEELRRALDHSHRATKWNPVAALALLASGIYLGSIGWWWQAWFYLAVAAWIVNLALATGVVKRSEAALARAAGTAGGPVTPAVDAVRSSRAWSIAHAALLANDLAMVYVMYVKPDLIAGVAVLLAANILALGTAIVRVGRSQTITESAIV